MLELLKSEKRKLKSSQKTVEGADVDVGRKKRLRKKEQERKKFRKNHLDDSSAKHFIFDFDILRLFKD